MNKIKPYLLKPPLILFVLMLVGLLVSRAVLSISTACWVIVIFAGVDREKFKENLPLIAWSLVPIFLFLLGAYQQITARANYDYLLTLMIYPVAAFGSIVLKSLKELTAKSWILLAFVSLLYPLFMYVFHFSEWNVLYGQGKSLPTLMDSDHVRYGLFLIASLMLVLFTRTINPKPRFLLMLVFVVPIIVMSVRTAWIGLLICFLSLLFFSKTAFRFNRLWTLLIIPIFAAAYFIFPAVSQKIKYTVYDWQAYQPETYNPDFSDGARRTINFVAWKSIGQQTSVGWAAVPSTLNKTFDEYFPGQRLNYGWPFNQWLFWCLGSGWLGVCLFTAWMFYPVYYGIKKKNYLLFAWTLVIAASCVVECTLNLQFGVFLHAWPICLFWMDTTPRASGTSKITSASI